MVIGVQKSGSLKVSSFLLFFFSFFFVCCEEDDDGIIIVLFCCFGGAKNDDERHSCLSSFLCALATNITTTMGCKLEKMRMSNIIACHCSIMGYKHEKITSLF